MTYVRVPPPGWRQRQHMGPQPGTGQLNPNANGTEVPYVPPDQFKQSQPQMGDPRRRIILPGADFPPADAIPVDEFGDGNIVSFPAGGPANVTILTIRVPDTYTFRISGIGFGADDESSLRFLAWTINATPPNAPILGYSQKPAAVGSIPQLSYIFACVGSSVVVTVTVTNNNLLPATLYFICRLQGWFYSEREVR